MQLPVRTDHQGQPMGAFAASTAAQDEPDGARITRRVPGKKVVSEMEARITKHGPLAWRPIHGQRPGTGEANEDKVKQEVWERGQWNCTISINARFLGLAAIGWANWRSCFLHPELKEFFDGRIARVQPVGCSGQAETVGGVNRLDKSNLITSPTPRSDFAPRKWDWLSRNEFERRYTPNMLSSRSNLRHECPPLSEIMRSQECTDTGKPHECDNRRQGMTNSTGPDQTPSGI